MAQPEKFIKIQSLESGSFNPQNDIINFVIPEGTYDLKDSYVAITVLPNVVPQVTTGTTRGLLPYFFTSPAGVGLDGRDGFNGYFVKNASLNSNRAGRLEDIRNTNIIHRDIYRRSLSFAEKKGLAYQNVSATVNENNIRQPGFLKLRKEGTDFTDMSEAYEVQIPINQFLRLGEMRQFNTSKMGRLVMRLELDFGIIAPQFYCKGGDGTDDLDFGGNKNRQCKPIAENVASITSLITNQLLGEDLTRSPYFVGQAISVSATGAGGATNITNARCVITGIEVITTGADAYKLELTVSPSIGSTGAGETYTDVLIGGGILNDPNDLIENIEFSTAEIRLKKIQDVPMDMLQYATVTNESDNGNGLAVYRNQYYVEPEAVAIYMIHTKNPSQIVSSDDAIGRYRISVDNVDVVGNRDVLLNSALMHELMNKTYLNLAIPLKNPSSLARVDSQYVTLNDVIEQKDAGLSDTFIGCPVPLTQNRKIVDIELVAQTSPPGVTIGNLELFKFVVKSVKL
jgi:hypothetical protein